MMIIIIILDLKLFILKNTLKDRITTLNCYYNNNNNNNNNSNNNKY